MEKGKKKKKISDGDSNLGFVLSGDFTAKVSGRRRSGVSIIRGPTWAETAYLI